MILKKIVDKLLMRGGRTPAQVELETLKNAVFALVSMLISLRIILLIHYIQG